MKIFNPLASQLEITLIASIEAMEKLGWDFSHYHNNYSEIMGVSIEEAEKYNRENYEFYLDVKGTSDNPVLNYGWYNQERNEYTEAEETGDDTQTVKDISELLTSGDMRIGFDGSVDRNGANIRGIVFQSCNTTDRVNCTDEA